MLFVYDLFWKQGLTLTQVLPFNCHPPASTSQVGYHYTYLEGVVWGSNSCLMKAIHTRIAVVHRQGLI